MRFDEVELEPVIFEAAAPPAADETTLTHAPRLRRLAALLVDLSLFAALALALSPLLPAAPGWMALTALSGFVLLVSYYYYVGTWMLWGKTIGGAIFDVRVVSDEGAMSLRNASLRWAGVMASLLLGGLGFVLAALPSRLSLPDRVSATRCVA